MYGWIWWTKLSDMIHSISLFQGVPIWNSFKENFNWRTYHLLFFSEYIRVCMKLNDHLIAETNIKENADPKDLIYIEDKPAVKVQYIESIKYYLILSYYQNQLRKNGDCGSSKHQYLNQIFQTIFCVWRKIT